MTTEENKYFGFVCLPDLFVCKVKAVATMTRQQRLRRISMLALFVCPFVLLVRSFVCLFVCCLFVCCPFVVRSFVFVRSFVP